MSIRSVDMQVLVQKVGDISRIQQTHQVEENNRQQEFNQAIVQQTDHNSKEVNQSLRSEEAYVHERQEKQKKEEKGQEKKGKKEDTANTDNKSQNMSQSGHRLDITV
ncbi:MAG TPA: hypothetical protein VN426_17345 [Syntrophomonadaceae bacterium]|nr:hypothetical protein [Syntrophomonadaceae bacterium]